MSGIFNSLRTKIRDTDIFAEPVLVSYKGKSSFKTPLGGCLTILLVTIFFGTALFILEDDIRDPSYKNLPVTYDYSYNETFELDTMTNMMSFKI